MSVLEKLISDARLLGNRLRERESHTDSLISQTSSLHDRVEAMKQYEEDLNKLNDIPKRKPRHKLIMEIAQESKQIRELKNENLELKACLEEHQSALDIIMTKYREQMRQFMMTKKLEDNILQVLENNTTTEGKMREKMSEMVKVMQQAAVVDDEHADLEQQKVTELVTENQGLREMLGINRSVGVKLPGMKQHQSVQTEAAGYLSGYLSPYDSVGDESTDDEDDDGNVTPESHYIGDSFSENDTVIEHDTLQDYS